MLHVRIISHAGDSASVCRAGKCEHKRARNWVQCEVCQMWLHCVCAGLSAASAKKTDYHFVCVECSDD